MRNVIKYGGIVLVIIGVLLVMKNLFAKDADWTNNNFSKKTSYYSVKVKLLDKENNSYLAGGKLAIKDSNGKVISEWTTDSGVHLVSKLKAGKYTLVQTKNVDNYNINDKGISFTIKNTDKELVMYNEKMTEDQVKEERAKNTTANEVGVESTGTSKSILTIVIAAISIIVGSRLIYKERNNY